MSAENPVTSCDVHVLVQKAAEPVSSSGGWPRWRAGKCGRRADADQAIATARYLWDVKHVVPILKVDKGLADEQHGVQLMKPIDTLDDLLARATGHRMFGTKMRSVIKDADKDGVGAIVEQQFNYGECIARGRSGPDPRTGGQHRQPTQGSRPRRCCTMRSPRIWMHCRPTRRSWSS